MPEHPDGPAPMPHRQPSGRPCGGSQPKAPTKPPGFWMGLAIIGFALLGEESCPKKPVTPGQGPEWQR